MQRLRPGIVVLVLALAVAACGNGDEEAPEATAPPATTPPVETTEPPVEPEEPTPTPTAEAEPEVYEVQEGDTLWDIAERFETTVDAIVEANDIEDPSAIFPGDELVIPPGG